MASAKLTALKLEKIGEMKVLPELTALDGSHGGLMPYPFKDERACILVENTNGSPGELRITKGDTFMGAAADYVYSIPGSKRVAINIDSAGLIQTKGEKKGCLEFKGPATLKVGGIVLP